MTRANGAKVLFSFLALFAAIQFLNGSMIEKNDPPTPVMDKAIAAWDKDQIVPHVAPLTDGGAWISWYSFTDQEYFQMWLQRIDRSGNPLFDAPGLLVADHPSPASWVTDYTLLTDESDNAVIVFPDAGSGRFTVWAYKISPSGEFLWGADGVSLDQPAGDSFTPRAVLTTDQEVTISWTQVGPNDTFVNVVVQRLSSSGSPRFGGGLTISLPHGKAKDSRLIASAEGSFILVWREIPSLTFGDNRGAIRAQRYDAVGAPLWPSAATISGQEYLPYYSWPQAVTDGRGGAFIAWNAFDSTGFGIIGYIQHISANGELTMPADGLPLSTEMTAQNWNKILLNLGPDPETGEAVVNWEESDLSQNRRRTVIDLFSMDGKRRWEPNGHPVGKFGDSKRHCIAVGVMKNAVACVFGSYAEWIPKSANSAILTTALSEIASPKGHFDIAPSPLGGFWVAWDDGRSDYGDIYVAFTPAPED